MEPQNTNDDKNGNRVLLDMMKRMEEMEKKIADLTKQVVRIIVLKLSQNFKGSARTTIKST